MRPGGRSRRGWVRADARLLSAFGACVAVFTALAVDVTHRGPLARFDPHVADWSVAHVPGGWHVACRWLTHLGGATLLTVLVVFSSAWLLTRQRRFDAFLVPIAEGTTALVTAGLKEGFRRSRPVYVDPVHGPHSFSFPSGHASGAFTVYLLLAILLPADATRRLRVSLVAGALSVAVLVAATRVLLPVHFLTDVVAGACVGLAAVCASMLVRSASAPRPLPFTHGRGR